MIDYSADLRHIMNNPLNYKEVLYNNIPFSLRNNFGNFSGVISMVFSWPYL